MAGVDLGSVYSRLELDIANFQKSIDVAQKDLDNFARTSSSAMSRTSKFSQTASSAIDEVTGALGGLILKTSALAIGGSIGLIGMAKYGFEAVQQIQGTVASMVSLTGSAEAAGKVIKEMVDYVQGKPFDRMEVLQASRNLLALGRTTQDLKGDIELLGRAVVYTGRDFASLALIYGQASASNRVMSGDLNQLVTAGIPILKTLSKQLGVTAQDVYKMAENGQIDFATFKKALEDALPADIVERNSNTISQRISSLRSSFRNLAFDILGVDFSKIDGRPLIKTGGLLDKIVDALEQVIVKLRAPEMREAFKALGEQAKNLANWLPKVVDALFFLAKHINDIVALIASMTVAWATLKAVNIVIHFVKITQAVGLAIKAMMGARTAIVALRAGLTALGVASATNPIILIIEAVALLIAGLVFLQIKFNIFGKAWDWLKERIQPLLPIFQAITTFVKDTLAQAFDSLKRIFNELKESFQPLIDAFREFYEKHGEGVRKVLGLIALALATLSLGPVVAAFAILLGLLKLVAVVLEFVADKFDTIKSVVTTVIKVALNPLITTVKLVHSVIDRFGIRWDEVWEKVKDVIDFVVKKVVEGIEFVKKVIRELREEVDKLGIKFQENKDKIATKWSELKTALSGGISLVINGFDGGVGTENLLASIETMKTTLNGMLDSILAPWRTSFSELGNLASQTFSNMAESLGLFVASLPARLSGIWESFTTAFNNAYSQVGIFVSNIGTAISGWIDGLPENLSGIWTSFTTAFETAYQNIVDFFTSLPGRLQPNTDKAGVDTATSFVDGAKKQMTTMDSIRKVGDAIMQLIGLAILVALAYVVDAAFRLGLEMIKGMGRGIGGAIGFIFEAIGRINNTILGFFGDAIGWLIEAGKNIVRGLIRGLDSMLDAVRRKASEIAEAVKNAASAALRMHSPSRVFVDIGKNVGKGFVMGLDDTKKDIIKTAKDIFSVKTMNIPSAQLQVAMNQQATVKTKEEVRPVNIYGDINVNNQQDADYLLQRLSRRQDLTMQGLTGV